MNKRVIIRGWHNSGEDFLAENLKKVFSILNSQGEVELHNDMVRNIQVMMGDDGSNFRKGVAGILVKKPKNFLLSVANLILNLSLRSVNNVQKSQSKQEHRKA